MHEAGQRKNLAKIWEHKLPDREEVCFENLTKISGRRVVELDLLAEALDRGCNTCAKPLQLSRITDETVSGLGSFLYIMCSNPDCRELNICQTKPTGCLAGCMDVQSSTLTQSLPQVCYVTL